MYICSGGRVTSARSYTSRKRKSILWARQRQLPEQQKPRAQRREEARALAKEMLRSEKIKPANTKLDKGWFLAAFMALALLLIAPKIGRAITAVLLVGMASCLVHPIWHLLLAPQCSASLLPIRCNHPLRDSRRRRAFAPSLIFPRPNPPR